MKVLSLILFLSLVFGAVSSQAMSCSKMATSVDFKDLKPKDPKDEDGFITEASSVPLSTKNLLNAYKNGVFPWNSNETGKTGWYSPKQHGVVPLRDLVGVGGAREKSLRKVWNKAKKLGWKITFNKEFDRVMEECARHERDPKKYGHVWLVDEVKAAFSKLHKEGHAHSVEVWDAQGNLIGGHYGIYRNGIFSAESMFNHRSLEDGSMEKVDNAGKVSVIAMARQLYKNGHSIIDTQTVNDNTRANYNAFGMERQDFVEFVKNEEQRLAKGVDTKILFPEEAMEIGAGQKEFEDMRTKVELDLTAFPSSPELTLSSTKDSVLSSKESKTIMLNKLKFDDRIRPVFVELIKLHKSNSLNEASLSWSLKTAEVKLENSTLLVFLKNLNFGLKLKIESDKTMSENDFIESLFSDFKTREYVDLESKVISDKQSISNESIKALWD